MGGGKLFARIILLFVVLFVAGNICAAHHEPVDYSKTKDFEELGTTLSTHWHPKIVKGIWLSKQGLKSIKLKIVVIDKKVRVIAYAKPDLESGREIWVNLPLGMDVIQELKTRPYSNIKYEKGEVPAMMINIKPYGDIYFWLRLGFL